MPRRTQNVGDARLMFYDMFCDIGTVYICNKEFLKHKPVSSRVIIFIIILLISCTHV